jgi:hypothetical protein
VTIFARVAPELDVTVIFAEQRPTFTPIIFAPDTLQFSVDEVAIVAFTDKPPVVKPAAAAAFTSEIDAPRFTVGDPTMFIDIDLFVTFPFFGLTLIVTVHLPGAIPTTFGPNTWQTAPEACDTTPDTFAPLGIDNCAAFASVDNACDRPVFTATVFAIAVVADDAVFEDGIVVESDEKFTARSRVKVNPIFRTPLVATDGLRVTCTRRMHRPTLVGMMFPSTI